MSILFGKLVKYFKNNNLLLIHDYNVLNFIPKQNLFF